MTRFVLSHNLQIQNSAVPPLAFEALAKALAEQCDSVTSSEALSHPHWKISLESTATPGQLAEELKQQLRQGERLAGDNQAIERMVAGLGDRRGLLRLTFAESLGTVGGAAVPALCTACLLYTSPSPRDATLSRMPSSA